jgi:hypothetical protein
MIRNRVKRVTSWFVLAAFLLPSLVLCSSATTLDDLKKLEIICFVPSYLPQGFQLKTVEITYDEVGPDENKEERFPLYSLEYGDGGKRTFSIESAREGIGDRNIMEEEENAEETEIKTPLGPMYLIYRPKGKEGRKDEIKGELDRGQQHDGGKGEGSTRISDSRTISWFLGGWNHSRGISKDRRFASSDKVELCGSACGSANFRA